MPTIDANTLNSLWYLVTKPFYLISNNFWSVESTFVMSYFLINIDFNLSQLWNGSLTFFQLNHFNALPAKWIPTIHNYSISIDRFIRKNISTMSSQPCGSSP